MNNVIAFISGGASGLGKGTLTYLIKNGARFVYVFDKQPFEFNDLPKSKVKAFQGDITEDNDVIKALEDCYTQFGPLNTLINCAGLSLPFKTYNFRTKRPHDLQDFRNVLKNNVFGTFNIIRLALKYLDQNEPDPINKQRGLIINTSGCAAFDGPTGQVAYSASAGAINGMTYPIALDIAQRGIRCCTISVGHFDTPALQKLPANLRAFISKITVCPQRMGSPEDYAKLVSSIIENPFINGVVIRIDGGLRFVI